MNEDNFLLNEIWNENSSDEDNIDSSSTSSSSDSSSTASSDYNPLLENDICEEDLLFPLLHFLNNGRRRQRVENFLHVVHVKSNEEFREDFRLTRPIVYQLLGN